jgi:homoserine O-acetyltransferase/O-succinyltransferase
MKSILFALLAAIASPAISAPPIVKSPVQAQTVWATREADVILKDFRFRSGERLPELRLHYTTLGQPHRNARGTIDNAIMVLHGTGGTGQQFLRPQFADELYGPGQPLDIRKYWIILPDNIGHGKSSKPSDGLRMKFPKYDYDDMVVAQHGMLQQLGVTQLRLIMGTSMGCMHAFVWGETYPTFAKALMPLACQPIEIAGLNRMWRQLVIDGIKSDPAWGEGTSAGQYDLEPVEGLRTAESILFIAGAAPLYLQETYPTRDRAAAFARQSVDKAIESLDANDMIYQFDSSRNYNPWPKLERIVAPVMWVNSADDFINPRNLDAPARAMKRMKNAQFRLIQETSQTHGHGTHTWAKFWKADLISLLARSE